MVRRGDDVFGPPVNEKGLAVAILKKKKKKRNVKKSPS
jgi:hypothetical protein